MQCDGAWAIAVLEKRDAEGTDATKEPGNGGRGMLDAIVGPHDGVLHVRTDFVTVAVLRPGEFSVW